MADGINTAMNAVEAIELYAAVGARLGDTHTSELFDRDNTVLSRRKTGNESVRTRIVALVPHVRN
jgi:hypothetical protein